MDDFLPLQQPAPTTVAQSHSASSFLVFQKLPPWWVPSSGQFSHIEKMSGLTLLTTYLQSQNRAWDYAFSKILREQSCNQGPKALSLSWDKPWVDVSCLSPCQGDGRKKKAYLYCVWAVKYWARRWWALPLASQFVISLERWNTFSIKSIGSGSDWLPGFRAQLCLLVVWPWPNHHISRPQFPYLLNGNNNRTSWNRARCWVGKSTTNKTQSDFQRAPKSGIKASIFLLSNPADPLCFISQAVTRVMTRW